jgi:hypothetical protein
MDDWPEGDVNRLARTWQDDDGRWWIVVFDLANLGGRIECVGVALQSRLRPDSDFGASSFYQLPEGAEEKGIAPRPLLAKTLRQLRFDEVLRSARGDHAGFLRSFAEGLRGPPTIFATEWGLNPEYFDEASALYTRGEGRAASIKTTQKLLERVAAIYQRAWREGEVPPSKAVEEALQVSSDQARKLVARCRKTDPPLLPTTERRKARGWLPGERDERSDP